MRGIEKPVIFGFLMTTSRQYLRSYEFVDFQALKGGVGPFI